MSDQHGKYPGQEEWAVSLPPNPENPNLPENGHDPEATCRDCAILRGQAAGLVPRSADTDTWLRDVDKVFRYLRDGTLPTATASVLTFDPGDRP